jgi:hypothetical protein
MAFIALHDGKPARPTKGAMGRCLDPECRGEMIAKIGSGLVKPHWAHRQAGDCALENNEESGWHLTWRTLFQLNGCTSEVYYDGRRHRADAVTPDGRVVEFQTTWLKWDAIRSREMVYDRMAWVYRVTDAETDLDLGEASLDGMASFVWYAPRRSMLAHERPVYWHRSDEAIWSIQTVYRTTDTTDAGAIIWKGVAQLIATDWAGFAERISNGEPFATAPDFQGFEALEARRAYAAATHAEPGTEVWLDMDAIDCQLNTKRPSNVVPFRPRIVSTADADTLKRVAYYEATSPKCSICRKPMVCNQPGAHYACKGTA